MILLGLDSASGACSAAVADQNGVRANRFEAMTRGQAEALAPMISDVLDEASLTAADLDAVAVTIGPGAFTGVRIGLSAARALALAAGKPVVGVTTFATVAEPFVGGQGHLLSVIESRRDDFFLQLISRQDGKASPPRAAYASEIPNLLELDGFAGGVLTLCGDGAVRLLEAGVLTGVDVEMAEGTGLPDAVWVARCARRLVDRDGLPDRAQRPAPLYLRPPDVGPPKFA